MEVIPLTVLQPQPSSSGQPQSTSQGLQPQLERRYSQREKRGGRIKALVDAETAPRQQRAARAGPKRAAKPKISMQAMAAHLDRV